MPRDPIKSQQKPSSGCYFPRQIWRPFARPREKQKNRVNNYEPSVDETCEIDFLRAFPTRTKYELGLPYRNARNTLSYVKH